MRRTFVDLLVVRTAKCEDDARIEKLLYLLSRHQLRIGLVCLTRSGSCERRDSERVKHHSIRARSHSTYAAYPRPLRRIVIIALWFRVVVFARRRFIPASVHGCDLDGWVIGKFVRLRAPSIFEVYDPWTTMVGGSLIKEIESRAFALATVVVMPAKDSRLKPSRKVYALGNELESNHARELLSRARVDWPHQPFILLGGNIGDEEVVRSFIRYLGGASSIRPLVVGHRSLWNEPNVISKDVLAWPSWLELISRASALWCYYDATKNHYASHISPNKYWEARAFGTPLIVNSIDQFIDRDWGSEPQIMQIGQNPGPQEFARVVGELVAWSPEESRGVTFVGARELAQERANTMAEILRGIRLL